MRILLLMLLAGTAWAGETAIHNVSGYTSTNSGIQEFTVLVFSDKGKVVATPPLFGPIVHLAEHELEQAGLTLGRDVTLRKNKSIDACFQQMVIGRADACLAPSFSVPPIQASLGRELRTLLQSGDVPNRLLVVRRQLPSHDQIRILKAFLDLRELSGGGELLATMNTKGFVAFDPQDYETEREVEWHVQRDHFKQ